MDRALLPVYVHYVTHPHESARLQFNVTTGEGGGGVVFC